MLEVVLYTALASGVEQSWNKVAGGDGGANQAKEEEVMMSLLCERKSLVIVFSLVFRATLMRRSS